jgi:hypothetical protein
MDELDYYRGQSQLTDPGTKRDLFGGLPADIAGMAEVIDGVMVHRDETEWRFGLLDRVAAVSEDGGPAPRAAGISRSDPRLPVPAEYVEPG